MPMVPQALVHDLFCKDGDIRITRRGFSSTEFRPIPGVSSPVTVSGPWEAVSNF